MRSSYPEIAPNVRRDIEVTDNEVDEVDKCIQVTVSAGAILDDLDDEVEPWRPPKFPHLWPLENPPPLR